MKKALILAIAIVAAMFFAACNRAVAPEIIRKDYKYEKSNWEFVFHLENIGNSDKISNLVNKLIYNSRNFDEYVSNMEKSVLENSDDMNLDTRGSYLSANYTIIYADEKYIVISYRYEEFYGSAPHPNHGGDYFFIDISEERLLLINDLIKPIPEKTLLDLIKKTYGEDVDIDIDDFLRDTIWPPDLIKISGENTALIWNTYTLLPHVFGPVEVTKEGTNYDISQHLTDKGKEIMKRLAAATPQAEKPTADDTETTAQTAETSEIDFGKLALKGDVYYLNNVPFTGKAIRYGESKYEMKDGRFHGRCEEWDGAERSVGNYKNGKKDGEWEISYHGDGDAEDKIEIWKDGKLIKEWTKEDEETQNEDTESWFGIDFDKLVLKDDVYYLNNVPFTGKAGYQKMEHESWEFKDGKYHGLYTFYLDGCETIGNYKNGKKDGEWKSSCGDGEETIRIWKDDVLISENGVLIK